MNYIPKFSCIYLMFAATHCSSASMTGGTQKKSPPQPAATSLPTPIPTALPQLPAPTNLPTVAPTETVQGQEVVTTCEQCLFRANQLCSSIGFSADISRARNEGYYKISPIRQLCDIHFLPSLSTRIRDHDGQSSSILIDQVAIYCPCDCVSNSPF